MRGIVSLDRNELTDAAVSKVRIDLELRYGIQPTDPETARAVQLVSSQNAFHPDREFLASLSWDGNPRFERAAADLLRIRAETDEEAAIASLLVVRWFIGLVARPFEPGCKLDTALILQGAQGAGKSTFFRAIGIRSPFARAPPSPAMNPSAARSVERRPRPTSAFRSAPSTNTCAGTFRTAACPGGRST